MMHLTDWMWRRLPHESAFISAGQRCTCARRLILRNRAPKDTLKQLVHLAQQLPVGKPHDTPTPFMGALIHGRAVDAVLDQYNALLSLGATSLLTPHRLGSDGAFLTPGIVDVTGIESMPDLECFGPLLQVSHVDSLDHAIALANATEYGLAAALRAG